jgi:hypothetical protein
MREAHTMLVESLLNKSFFFIETSSSCILLLGHLVLPVDAEYILSSKGARA